MTEPGNDSAKVSLTLRFEPVAEQIGSLRSALSDLCEPHLADPDELSQLLLAAHELLENIVKYSSGGVAEFHFSLEPAEAGLRARLRTRNRARPDRLNDVQHRLDALAAAKDAVAHYDEVIRESAGRRDGSGLGLARIEAESEMRLQYAVEHDSLVISAEVTVSERAR